MKNFKPSELPVGTVIYDEEEGSYYTKEFSFYQMRLFWNPSSCEDCSGSYTVADIHADVAFKNFKIIALPMSVVEYILENMDGMTDSDELLKFAVTQHHVKPRYAY